MEEKLTEMGEEKKREGYEKEKTERERARKGIERRGEEENSEEDVERRITEYSNRRESSYTEKRLKTLRLGRTHMNEVREMKRVREKYNVCRKGKMIFRPLS
ncbi:hypothetical protein R5R35_001185 [Gryllus longicercus]|uniref:Uncharacterized protein n=1 Tax=Gryllus longicercus TaxID=2509291 RepID=A0AAN9VLH2_9ORTH